MIKLITCMCLLLSLFSSAQGVSAKTSSHCDSIERHSKYTQLSNEANALVGQGRVREAITVLTNTLELNLNQSSILRRRSGLYVVQKDFLSALNDLNKVIETDKDDLADVYFLRGMCKLALNRSDQHSACPDFKKAQELGYTDLDETIKSICNL